MFLIPYGKGGAVSIAKLRECSSLKCLSAALLAACILFLACSQAMVYNLRNKDMFFVNCSLNRR